MFVRSIKMRNIFKEKPNVECLYMNKNESESYKHAREWSEIFKSYCLQPPMPQHGMPGFYIWGKKNDIFGWLEFFPFISLRFSVVQHPQQHLLGENVRVPSAWNSFIFVKQIWVNTLLSCKTLNVQCLHIFGLLPTTHFAGWIFSHLLLIFSY